MGQSKVNVTETFKGRVNCIKLIRQLGTKDGHFTESVGKKRAIELVEKLSTVADKCISAGTYRNVTLADDKNDVHMLDTEARAAVAYGYTDSEEAQKLCSVSLMNKQDTIFNAVKNHVNNTKIYGKRRKDILAKQRKAIAKKRKVFAEPMAKVVYNRKNYLEVIEADMNLALKVIKKELDQTGVQRIDMPDATYIRLNNGTAAEPAYQVYKIENQLYVEAYVAATKFSPKVKR